MKKNLLVRDLFSEMHSILSWNRVVSDKSVLENRITVPDLNRSGLIFAGYAEGFSSERIQIIGITEMSFLKQLTKRTFVSRIKKFMSYQPPLIIFTNDIKVPSLFIEEAQRLKIAIFSSSMATTRLLGNLTLFLEDVFAESTNFHGTLMDVHGVGILLLGGSGVGKSECALELVERGHRLVADDVVIVQKKMGRYLIGKGTEFIRHHMEIRGLGIIDVRSIYGASAVRHQKNIEFVVNLEEWDSAKEYERLGLKERFYKILGLPLPYFVIPVKLGRNIAILIEVAASTHRLKKMGKNPVLDMEKNMIRFMKDKKK